MTETLRTAGRVALAAGLAGLTLTFGATAAKAQPVTESSRYDWAVRLGTYIPTDDDVRRAGGTHNLAVEVDWVAQRLPGQQLTSILSLGYIERDGFKLIPATISLIRREYSDDLNKSYYYGFGGGLYQTRVRASDTSGENKWIPGGFIVMGVDLTDRYFGEFKYNYINKYDGKFVGGSQLSVGIRF